jgi:hypothetical protein
MNFTKKTEIPENKVTKQSAMQTMLLLIKELALPFDIKEMVIINKEKKEFFFKSSLSISPHILSCIMLNDIEAAHEQLNLLYTLMDVDYIAQIIDDTEGSMMMEDEKSYLYTLKIVMAENLVALDSNGLSDMYCVISDEGR